MGNLKKEEFKVGDYVSFMYRPDWYRVGIVTEVTKPPIRDAEYISICAYWSVKGFQRLPRTMEEFNLIEKLKVIRMATNGILEKLDFTEKQVLKSKKSNLKEKLLNIENYESSTIIALNERLGDGLDFEDILKLLIPNITKIAEN